MILSEMIKISVRNYEWTRKQIYHVIRSIYGKNNFIWAAKDQNRAVRNPKLTIGVQLPGLKGYEKTRLEAEPEETWN